MGGSGEDTVKPYPVAEDLVRPVPRVGMPRAPRVVAPGGTIHELAVGSGQTAEIRGQRDRGRMAEREA